MGLNNAKAFQCFEFKHYPRGNPQSRDAVTKTIYIEFWNATQRDQIAGANLKRLLRHGAEVLLEKDKTFMQLDLKRQDVEHLYE